MNPEPELIIKKHYPEIKAYKFTCSFDGNNFFGIISFSKSSWGYLLNSPLPNKNNFETVDVGYDSFEKAKSEVEKEIIKWSNLSEKEKEKISRKNFSLLEWIKTILDRSQ